MKINEAGFWENNTAEGHEHDEGLAKVIVKFLQVNDADDVIDMGCGDGYYTNYINNFDIPCIAVDGNPHTANLVGRGVFILDLSKKVTIGKFSWVLSLEVGEHIPSDREAVFLENLNYHAIDGLILSWAVRGQGGDGHINCLDNWEVIEKIEALGFEMDIESTVNMRLACADYPTPCYWFKDTLMVFRRPERCRFGFASSES